LALLFTMGALVAFLIEMLLASRGLRDQANSANEVGEALEQAADIAGEPTPAGESSQALGDTGNWLEGMERARPRLERDPM
jgi:hypothetical protein